MQQAELDERDDVAAEEDEVNPTDVDMAYYQDEFNAAKALTNHKDQMNRMVEIILCYLGEALNANVLDGTFESALNFAVCFRRQERGKDRRKVGRMVTKWKRVTALFIERALGKVPKKGSGTYAFVKLGVQQLIDTVNNKTKSVNVVSKAFKKHAESAGIV